MSWTMIMATKKRDIISKISWRRQQELEQQELEKARDKADKKYSIKQISGEHFKDERK